MNHLEFAALETSMLKDNPWDKWLDEVKRLTGIENLDGDDYEGCPEPDGYSLDRCVVWFSADVKPADAARRIIARRAELGFSDSEDIDAPDDGCTNPNGHEWEYSGTAYGGEDSSYMGEGRCYCVHCGADGDA